MGDFLAVPNCGDLLPWAIGEVTAVVGDYEGDVMPGYDGSEIKRGDPVVQLRRWLPLEAGGGGSLYEAGGDVSPALASTILFRISAADADKKMFKKARSKVVPQCSKGHVLLSKGPSPSKTCQMNVRRARYGVVVRCR